MASISVKCVCGLSMSRLPSKIVRCACCLYHVPDWSEFSQPIRSTDEDNQMAFMLLPFQPIESSNLIYPHIPCLPVLEASGKVAVFEPQFGVNCHPFWLAIKGAFDQSAADWRWQLQEISEVGAIAPSPFQYHQRLQRLRINCACINCSCINYSK
jgi:hypothetical protein